MTLGDLFTPPPLTWGLRGDPHLWEAMRRRFADDPFPPDEWVLLDAVRAAFLDLTGVRLAAGLGHVAVPAYRTGSGMSDGFVSGEWWHTVGLVLLVDRWNVARSR